MIDATKIFGHHTPQSTPQWKPVSPTGSSSGVAAHPAQAPRDRLSVSPLGDALKGTAAQAFEQLDAKARGVLEGLVDSGKASAADVVNGLRFMASWAGFNRYLDEAPADESEQKARAELNTLDDAAKERMQRDAQLGAMRAEAGRAFERGEIDADTYGERMDAFASSLQALHGSADDAGAARSGALINGIFSGKIHTYSAIRSATGDADANGTPWTEKERAAAAKLQNLGFDQSVYRDAFQRYAAGLDLSGPPKG